MCVLLSTSTQPPPPPTPRALKNIVQHGFESRRLSLLSTNRQEQIYIAFYSQRFVQLYKPVIEKRSTRNNYWVGNLAARMRWNKRPFVIWIPPNGHFWPNLHLAQMARQGHASKSLCLWLSVLNIAVFVRRIHISSSDVETSWSHIQIPMKCNNISMAWSTIVCAILASCSPYEIRSNTLAILNGVQKNEWEKKKSGFELKAESQSLS